MAAALSPVWAFKGTHAATAQSTAPAAKAGAHLPRLLFSICRAIRATSKLAPQRSRKLGCAGKATQPPQPFGAGPPLPTRMLTVKEVQRRPSPGARPQPLAFHGGRLWVGSWDTNTLYAVDPRTWSVAEQIAAPGRPYGMASFDGSLSVVVSDGDDDRYLYRCTPGKGFDPSSKTACPDFTGSHLATDGKTIYLCQQGNRRILVIDPSANVQREIALPTRCAGFGFGPSGDSFMISGDAELENLVLARIDLRESAPTATRIASIPFDARALTFDGAMCWTSHRDASEIVAFTA